MNLTVRRKLKLKKLGKGNWQNTRKKEKKKKTGNNSKESSILSTID